jgi:hypothetical protein
VGVYVYWRLSPPGGGVSADVIWGKKYERGKIKIRKCERKSREDYR